MMGKRTLAVLLGAFAHTPYIGMELTCFTLLTFFYLCALLYARPYVHHGAFQFAAMSVGCQFVFAFSAVYVLAPPAPVIRANF
jgi:hypothetical protein